MVIFNRVLTILAKTHLKSTLVFRQIRPLFFNRCTLSNYVYHFFINIY
jgi:hypothetical protein